MRRTEAFAVAAAFCASLSACAPADQTVQAPADEHAPKREVAHVPAAAPPTATPAQDAATPAGRADRNQATPTAARQTVIDYYDAINARDYPRAYAMWGDNGAASGQSYEHFSGGYANTRSVKASVGQPGHEEGAAGSRFIQVPLELKALQRDGSERNYRGHFALRAVMADGASEEQRHWHLASAEMQRLTD